MGQWWKFQIRMWEHQKQALWNHCFEGYMILDALVLTSSCKANPPLPFWHQLYFIHHWYMPMSLCGHIASYLCQALKTWRTMWSGYFEANLLAVGGEAGHPCSCRLGGWPIQTTHLQTISSSFVVGFSGTVISFKGWMASPLQVPKGNWTGCAATNKSDSLVQAVVVACGDYETAAMIDRLVNTETWAIDEGLKRISLWWERGRNPPQSAKIGRSAISTFRKNHIAMKHGPRMKMFFLLKMGMFQPAMLVLPGRVTIFRSLTKPCGIVAAWCSDFRVNHWNVIHFETSKQGRHMTISHTRESEILHSSQNISKDPPWISGSGDIWIPNLRVLKLVSHLPLNVCMKPLLIPKHTANHWSLATSQKL